MKDTHPQEEEDMRGTAYFMFTRPAFESVGIFGVM